MATWQNLVDESGGDTLDTVRRDSIQEGADVNLYAGPYQVLDDNAEFTDVDLTGVTAEWVVYDKLDGTVILTLETSIMENQVKGHAAAADTADLGGAGRLGRRCPMSLVLTKGGETIPAFGPQDSILIIKQGD